VHATIKAMVLKGEISRARIDESYTRITRLKSRLVEGQTLANAMQLEAVMQKERADKAVAELEALKANIAAEEGGKKKKKKRRS
jgi:hypothetical protein